MKIKIILTKGDPITVTEEQAQAILSSSESLIAVKDATGKWNGDVIHRAHIVQMTRDKDAEREERLKNLRLAEAKGQDVDATDMREMLKRNRPRFIKDLY